MRKWLLTDSGLLCVGILRADELDIEQTGGLRNLVMDASDTIRWPTSSSDVDDKVSNLSKKVCLLK